ncbi:HNH endonuclease [Muricoccus radiodurans]|uniref:HNH endonuclease n=1 Tax=Muricoccus radiodurans TaxID=2231721 RepID=UPI003CEF7761
MDRMSASCIAAAGSGPAVIRQIWPWRLCALPCQAQLGPADRGIRGSAKRVAPSGTPASIVNAFLRTLEWTRVRDEALRASDGRCELCGRGKQDGVRLNVDHVRPRRTHPHLALDVRNLQVLDDAWNAEKGNRFEDDWRPANHPHRS